MTSLSVLCITHDPGPQVAAALAPLRAVATEIVVVADARTSAEDLGHYAAASDRLLRYPFEPPVERPYGWAHAQCTGDWILRIDGDEVPSPELVAALPALIARRDRLQYWIPRRWSYPDAGHWIDERPWAPDRQLRLVRNDPATMSFAGLMHTAALPHQPYALIAEPIYHVDMLVSPLDHRRRKARGYEALRPGLQAPGGGPFELYYLPEDWATRPPATTPPETVALLERVLHPTAAPVTPVDPDRVPLATRDDIDRHWDPRPLTGADYHAAIESLDTDLRLAPGRADALDLRVTNLGTAAWPGGLDREPLVRLGHRWLDADARVVDDSTFRTALPSSVAPGESAVVALSLIAPPEPGDYVVEVDLVHELVRWFEDPLRIPVTVAERPRPRARRSDELRRRVA